MGRATSGVYHEILSPQRGHRDRLEGDCRGRPAREAWLAVECLSPQHRSTTKLAQSRGQPGKSKFHVEEAAVDADSQRRGTRCGQEPAAGGAAGPNTAIMLAGDRGGLRRYAAGACKPVRLQSSQEIRLGEGGSRAKEACLRQRPGGRVGAFSGRPPGPTPGTAAGCISPTAGLTGGVPRDRRHLIQAGWRPG